MKILGKEYQVRPLEWVETHGGAWLRAESGKQVYEINTFRADIEAEKAACQQRHNEYVLSLVEELQAKKELQPQSALKP
jgi:hypothetical protein